MTGTAELYHNEPVADTARRIRAAVQEATGLSVSIGGGTSCLVAKLAAGIAKPLPGTGGDGVHGVEPGGAGEFLRRFRLADRPFVGPKFRGRRRRLGLRRGDEERGQARRPL